jgi:hypothetical protein
MPQKPARKKLLITRNAGPPSPMSARCRTLPPYEAYGVRITRRCHCPIFFTQGGPHSPPKSPRTPEMLLGSMQGYITPCRELGGSLVAELLCSATIRSRTRTEKVPWRRCSCIHLAAPRCPRRPPAWWLPSYERPERDPPDYTIA